MSTIQLTENSFGPAIRSIPTLMIFRDGILLYEQPGALPAAALEQLITRVQALDMAAVREQATPRAATA
jgi:thioredoxin 1